MTPDTIKVLPPALERAEEKFKGDKMTRKVDRQNIVNVLPFGLDRIIGRVAEQMPLVFLLGFVAYKLDQRNEEASKARLAQAEDSYKTMTAVVQSNTVVMQQAVRAMEEVPKALDTFRETLRRP